MNDKKRTTTDQILDLLLNALRERERELEQRSGGAEGSRSGGEQEQGREPDLEQQIEEVVEEHTEERVEEPPRLRVIQPTSQLKEKEQKIEETAVLSEIETAVPPHSSSPRDHRSPPPSPPAPLPSLNFDFMLRRLSIALVVLVILINIPFNRYGTSLARALPDSAAIIIRDGLLLKGSGEKVYVLENNQRRWITSLDAFERYGYRWSNVQQVDDEFLARFEDGNPVHLLLKCTSSPHVYAFEDGTKRWIKDVPTFQAQGYIWEDIKYHSCSYIRELPDGPPIPEDAGSPPQP